jgi:outer membrane protein, protease secretion system
VRLKSLVLGLCLMGGALGEASAFDLFQAYDYALANDPSFQSSIKEYEAGLANETIGRAALYPKLNASYYAAQNNATQWGRAYSGGPNQALSWQYPSNYYGLFLNQPLFSLEAVARMKQGSAQADAARNKFINSSQQLLIRVLQAYVEVLFAQDQLSYIEAERDSYKQQAVTNEKLQSKGFATITDVLEAKAAYQLSEAKVIEASNVLLLKRKELENITKASEKDLQKLAVLNHRFRMFRLNPATYEDWKQKALEANPELASISNQVEASRQEYKKNHAAHFPVVSIVGGITSQQSNSVVSIQNTTNQSYIGVQVNVPIFQGGEIVGRSNQTFAGYERAVSERDVALNKVTTEVKKQYDLVVTSSQKIDALSKAVESSEHLVRATKASIKGGEKTNLDALVADRSLFVSKRDLAQAKYTYLIAYLQLQQLGGSLTIDEFNKVAEFFGTHKVVQR